MLAPFARARGLRGLCALLIGVTFGLGSALAGAAPAAPPPAPAPQIAITGLHVQGNQIVNGSGQALQLHGVNRSGTEFACIQGWGIFDGPVDNTAIAAIAAWRTNAVRVPLNEDCWLAINGVPPAYSGANYQNAIVSFVNRLNAHGLVVILDLHWSAPGTTPATSQQPMADRDHSPAFWTGVANTFKNNSSVIFDLFNEPYPDSNQDTTAAWQCWKWGGTCPGVSYQAVGMRDLLAAVRGTGATNVVIMGGVVYANALSQWGAYHPLDSLHNLAIGWHAYQGNACGHVACWDNVVAPLARYIPLVTGEFGENDCAHGYIDQLLPWLDSHKAGYLPWTWNTWNCSSAPALISDYTGTPTNYGLGYKNHLAGLP